MTTVKTIAIIGATEKLGSAIAKSLSKGKHRLLLMADDSEKLDGLKTELENTGSKSEVLAITCAKEACWEADIIIVATPYETEKNVADRIREVATGKIVISISNPMNSHYSEVVPSMDTSAAEELQKMLPYSKVVKTFNTALASEFISLAINGKPADTFIAGNNGDAVDTVSEMVRSAGFNPMVAGDLSVSRMLERMQLLLIQQGIKNNYPGMNSWNNERH